jgi:cysteine desulfurase / selenocysteine lyase
MAKATKARARRTANSTFDVARIRADFPVLNRRINRRPLVYLDSAATSQKPAVMIRRINEIYSRDYAKVEEAHFLSRQATKAFEETRGKIAKLINAAEAREIVFTRGATEAINLVYLMLVQSDFAKGDEILVTQAEHQSNLIPWMLACRAKGAKLKVAPVTLEGEIDLEAFGRMLSPRVKLAAFTHVSNVTGGIMPVKRLTEMAQAKGAMVLVDGAQALPHIPVDVRDIGCEFYVGSGHKMGGPSSVGFLYGRADVLESMPAADGGSTMAESVTESDFTTRPIPHKYEAGEPAFGEVEAWSPALDYWMKLGLERIAEYEKVLTNYAASLLSEISGVTVLGRPKERISVVSFVVDGIDSKGIETALDAKGVAVRSGTLSADLMVKALGATTAVRASFMFYNTRREAEFLAKSIAQISS